MCDYSINSDAILGNFRQFIMAQNISLLSVRLHSTKLLCGILLSGVINIANATTSTQEIPIVVTVNPVCT